MADQTALIIARMLGGGFFVWVGSAKLGHARSFWSEVMGYEIVGPRLGRVLASAIVPIEFVCGLLFAAGVYPILNGAFLLILLATFSVAMVISLVRKTGNNCGCGVASSRVRPALLGRNAILAALITAGIFSPVPEYKGAPIVLLVAVLILFALALGSYRRLAD